MSSYIRLERRQSFERPAPHLRQTAGRRRGRPPAEVFERPVVLQPRHHRPARTRPVEDEHPNPYVTRQSGGSRPMIWNGTSHQWERTAPDVSNDVSNDVEMYIPANGSEMEQRRALERDWMLAHLRERERERQMTRIVREEQERFNFYEHRNEKLLYASNRDTTVHLELQIGIDIEQEHEDFSELTRRGDFRSAKRYFAENLQEYTDSPYVLLRHSQMMLDMGDHRVTSMPDLNINDLEVRSGGNDLGTMCALIRDSHRARNGQKDPFPGLEIDVRIPSDRLSSSRPTHEEIHFGSSQIQIHCLLARYTAHHNRYNLRRSLPMLLDLGCQKALIAQGRIWDFRDLIIAESAWLQSMFVPKNVLEGFISARDDTAGSCDELLKQWMTHPSDLLTNLALLDILVCLALIAPLSSKTLAGARELVNRGQEIVASITTHHQSALRSRQYAQWILAKIAVTGYQQDDSSFTLPGYFLPKEDALDLRIYIPFRSEIPTPQSPSQRSTYTAKTELALSIARQFEDYQTESMCLKQLIMQSPNPEAVLDELFHFQHGTQNDIHGALRTLLARYPFCLDVISRDQLREQILGLGSCEGLAPTMQWARSMMLRTLAQTNDEADQQLRKAGSFYDEVTEDVRMFMERNGWVDEKMQDRVKAKEHSLPQSEHRPHNPTQDNNVTRSDFHARRNIESHPVDRRYWEEAAKAREDRSSTKRRTKLSTTGPPDHYPPMLPEPDSPSSPNSPSSPSYHTIPSPILTDFPPEDQKILISELKKLVEKAKEEAHERERPISVIQVGDSRSRSRNSFSAKSFTREADEIDTRSRQPQSQPQPRLLIEYGGEPAGDNNVYPNDNDVPDDDDGSDDGRDEGESMPISERISIIKTN